MTLNVLESLEMRFEDLKGLCLSLRLEVSNIKALHDKALSKVKDADRKCRIKRLRFSRKLMDLRWGHQLPEGGLRQAWKIWSNMIIRVREVAEVDELEPAEDSKQEVQEQSINESKDESKNLMRRLSIMSLEANRNKRKSIQEDGAEEISQVMRKLKLKRNELMARKEDNAVTAYGTKTNIRAMRSEELRKDLLRVVFGIQPRDDSRGVLGSKLVDPFSRFHAGVL